MTEVKRVTKTGALLAHIKRLGLDKFGNPIGIRTSALAEATGVPKNSIQALLDAAVIRGDLVVCKITNANNVQEREYRAGPGVPPPQFVPLNTRRANIAHGAITKPLPVTTPAPAVSTPRPAIAAIVTPTFIKPTQPEVVVQSAEKTPAAEALPPTGADTAVAAQATPKPQAGAALKKEPAAPKASAGDVRIGINDSGTLVIAIDDDRIELNQKQAQRLGHFMIGTQGVWNPF